MSQNVPKQPSLKVAIRRSKIIALSAKGKTGEEIAETLKVSRKTVDRDLHSAEVQEFSKGLVERQIEDIESVTKVPVRLQYRSDLLDKLLPKKMEQKIEGGESFRVEIVDNSKESKNNQVSASPSTA